MICCKVYAERARTANAKTLLPPEHRRIKLATRWQGEWENLLRMMFLTRGRDGIAEASESQEREKAMEDWSI